MINFNALCFVIFLLVGFVMLLEIETTYTAKISKERFPSARSTFRHQLDPQDN